MLRRSEGATVDEVAAPHRARRLFWNAEEETRAHDCLGQRGTRPRLPYQWTGNRMKPSFHEASARQNSGGPSPVPGRGGDRENQPRSADIAKLEVDIIGLVDRSTQDLLLAWRQVHRTEPPPGLSRDLLTRLLAHRLQEETHGGTSPRRGGSHRCNFGRSWPGPCRLRIP